MDRPLLYVSVVKTPLLAAAALVLGLSSLVGCSEQTSNDAPILDSVNAPLSVEAKNGAYAIPVTILFHDNDAETVTHVRCRVGSSFDTLLEIPGPNPTRQSADVTLVLPASAREEAAKHPIELSVVDGRGAESHAFSTIVVLN